MIERVVVRAARASVWWSLLQFMNAMARSVGQPEAEHRLEEALGHRHVAAIDDNMGKTKRAIMAVASLAGQAIAMHDPAGAARVVL